MTIPDFSRPAFSFVLLGSLRFRDSAEGGPASPIQSDYRCQLRYDEPGANDSFDVRIYFVGEKAVNPGEDAAVVLAFLNPEQARQLCRVGTKFTLCEGTTVKASGVVHSLASR